MRTKCLRSASVVLCLFFAAGFELVFAAAAKASLRELPDPLYGVTVDSVDRLSAIVDSLQSLSRRPTTRIVFDKVSPAKYVDAVNEIYEVSYVMGELLDSYYMKDYTVDAYLQRTAEYLEVLGPKVDIWEVGNEINGDWLGDPESVLAKMRGGYDLVKKHGKRAALTLYHDQSSEDMLRWAAEQVPEYMKQGLDYVFVSFYEDDQNGIQPDWPHVFRRLAAIFPNSKIGFGEVGTQYWGRKKNYINRYYTMNIAHPNFVGGYFWWYFYQDMVPSSKPLWKALDTILAAGA